MLGGNPLHRIDPYGFDWLDSAANFSGGFGDYLTSGFGLSYLVGLPSFTETARKALGSDGVIDRCSDAYAGGQWAGTAWSLAFSGVGSLSGGARTVLYSGDDAIRLARAARASSGGALRLLEDTLGGKVLNMVDTVVPLPKTVWQAASGIFAGNAKGTVTAFLRNPSPTGIYATAELPMLNLMNKVNSFFGFKGTSLLLGP